MNTNHECNPKNDGSTNSYCLDKKEEEHAKEEEKSPFSRLSLSKTRKLRQKRNQRNLTMMAISSNNMQNETDVNPSSSRTSNCSLNEEDETYKDKKEENKYSKGNEKSKEFESSSSIVARTITKQILPHGCSHGSNNFNNRSSSSLSTSPTSPKIIFEINVDLSSSSSEEEEENSCSEKFESSFKLKTCKKTMKNNKKNPMSNVHEPILYNNNDEHTKTNTSDCNKKDASTTIKSTWEVDTNNNDDDHNNRMKNHQKDTKQCYSNKEAREDKEGDGSITLLCQKLNFNQHIHEGQMSGNQPLDVNNDHNNSYDNNNINNINNYNHCNHDNHEYGDDFSINDNDYNDDDDDDYNYDNSENITHGDNNQEAESQSLPQQSKAINRNSALFDDDDDDENSSTGSGCFNFAASSFKMKVKMKGTRKRTKTFTTTNKKMNTNVNHKNTDASKQNSRIQKKQKFDYKSLHDSDSDSMLDSPDYDDDDDDDGWFSSTRSSSRKSLSSSSKSTPQGSKSHSSTSFPKNDPLKASASISTVATSSTTPTSSGQICYQGLRNRLHYDSFEVLERKGLISSSSYNSPKRKRRLIRDRHLHNNNNNSTNNYNQKNSPSSRASRSVCKQFNVHNTFTSPTEDIIDCSSSDEEWDASKLCRKLNYKDITRNNHNNATSASHSSGKMNDRFNQHNDSGNGLILFDNHLSNESSKPKRRDIICIHSDSDGDEDGYDHDFQLMLKSSSNSSNPSSSHQKRKIVSNSTKKDTKKIDSRIINSRKRRQSSEIRQHTYQSNFASSAVVIAAATTASSSLTAARDSYSSSAVISRGRKSSSFHSNQLLMLSSNRLNNETIDNIRKSRNDLNGGSGTGLGGVILNCNFDPDIEDNELDNNTIVRQQSTRGSSSTLGGSRSGTALSSRKTQAKGRKRSTSSSRKGKGRGRGGSGSSFYAKGKGGWRKKRSKTSYSSSNNANNIAVSSWSSRERGLGPYNGDSGGNRSGGAWGSTSSSREPYMNVANIDPQLRNFGGATIVYE